MSICESSELCSFFTNEMKNMPSLVRAMKKRYCESDKENCARYMVKKMLFKGYTLRDDKAVSELENELNSMFPNDRSKAERIISQMEM